MGVPLSTRIVAGQLTGAILDVAESERASFIVMGTVGAVSAWDKLIGSVASSVAQQANRTVWILPDAVEFDSLRTFAYWELISGGVESFVRVHQPDAIVLAHRNREFIEKLFHTSLIRYLSLTTKLPLLTISKRG